MKIKTGINFNMDLLNILNVMTADELFTGKHRAAFDRFYPSLSDSTKEGIRGFVNEQGYSLISNSLTLFISSMEDFNWRDLIEMLLREPAWDKAVRQQPDIRLRVP